MKEINITDESFKKEVLESNLPVLVDFWAPWCGPCKMIAPAVAKLAETYDGRLKVCKMNVDENTRIVTKLGYSSIPTLCVFKNGQMAGQRMGAASYNVLDAFIQEFLD
ncbi:MAG: thioredoxin [Sphaerochaetaceae bacterium]|jgi:thioredoxin 1|nr:thioredoxin [Sphaerochaetaceae bacterium]